MKKIYTLLAAACVSASALALPVQKLQNVDMTKIPSQIPTEKMVETSSLGLDKMMKIINKNDNTEWASLIALVGEWGLTYQDGTVATIIDFPFMRLLVSCQPLGTGENSAYQFNINWPVYGALDDDCWMFNDQGQATGLDEAKVREKYQDKALQPMSYDDFIEAFIVNGDTRLYALPGFYLQPCIVGNEAVTQQPLFTVKGNEYYMLSATIENNKFDITNASYLDWKSYDTATSDIVLEMNATYSATAAGPLAGTSTADLQGESVVLGFADIVWDTIGQVHIFNAGRQVYGDEFTWNYATGFDGALNYYYIAFCDDTMGYQGYNSANEFMTNYTERDLPFNENLKLYGCPAYSFTDNSHLTFIAGALWAPEGTTMPYGKWVMSEPEIQNNKYVLQPKAWDLLMHDNSAAGAQDGFYGLYEGYTQIAMPGSAIGIGDSKMGLNYRLVSSMTNGKFIMGTFADNIYYHGTPDKWVSDIQEIPAVGDGDYDVITGATAVEAVESDAPVVSKSFYNFQGQRLSSEPESGMYIIRAVKADGTVKSTKVAK